MSVYATRREALPPDHAAFGSNVDFALIEETPHGYCSDQFWYTCKDHVQDKFWQAALSPVNIRLGAEWYHLGIYENRPTRPSYLDVFLNFFEEAAEIPLTTMEVVSKTTSILRFSGYWTERPIRMSMYTTLIRSGVRATPDVEPLKYLREIRDGERQSSSTRDSAYLLLRGYQRIEDWVLRGERFDRLLWTHLGSQGNNTDGKTFHHHGTGLSGWEGNLPSEKTK